MIDPSYIYVIIDSAKNNLRKTEYNISNNLSGDSWVQLKRSKPRSSVVRAICVHFGCALGAYSAENTFQSHTYGANLP
jgi:Rieske Fe-S protein